MGMVACGDDEEEPAAPPPPPPGDRPTVTTDMIDHGYQVSGPLIGGTLRITNKGTEFHMMEIVRFKPGKTLADLETVLREAGPPGGGGGGEGGPPTTAAGPTTTAARGATTTSGPTTTAAAGAAGQGGEEQQNPLAEIADEVGLPGTFMSPGESAEVTVPTSSRARTP